jgi:hypothetical protein
MIQIDDEYAVLRILDIAANQVDHTKVQHGIWNRVAGFEEYVDKSQLHENIYSAEVLQKMWDAGVQPDKEVVDLLEEIQLLCDQYECSYWRVIDIKFENNQ